MDKQKNIFLLMRYHLGRKELMRRALNSAREQTYKDFGIIVSYETPEEFDELMDLEFENGHIIDITLLVKGNREKECFFNEFLNDLKQVPKDCFMLIYDSDNYFYLPDSLEKLSKVLIDENQIYICQFVRKGKVKPNDRQIDERIIKSGSIDSASIVFHSKHKDVAMFGGNDNSDFFYIKEMTEKLPTSYHKIRVIESDRRSRGLN